MLWVSTGFQCMSPAQPISKLPMSDDVADGGRYYGQNVVVCEHRGLNIPRQVEV